MFARFHAGVRKNARVEPWKVVYHEEEELVCSCGTTQDLVHSVSTCALDFLLGNFLLECRPCEFIALFVSRSDTGNGMSKSRKYAHLWTSVSISKPETAELGGKLYLCGRISSEFWRCREQIFVHVCAFVCRDNGNSWQIRCRPSLWKKRLIHFRRHTWRRNTYFLHLFNSVNVVFCFPPFLYITRAQNNVDFALHYSCTVWQLERSFQRGRVGKMSPAPK